MYLEESSMRRWKGWDVLAERFYLGHTFERKFNEKMERLGVLESEFTEILEGLDVLQGKFNEKMEGLGCI